MVMFAAKETSGALMRRARATAGPRKANSATRTRRAKDDGACAEARITTACVDMTSFRARTIPENLREIFERYGEDEPQPGDLVVR